MQWTCIKCGLPKVSTSLFDSRMSSINSSLNLDEEMLRVKSKSLKVVTVNFQSIYNKKDELSSFLFENNADIVLGSETHLSPTINNAEILPSMYTSYRCDRADGWCWVIIIAKKNLTVKEIKIKKECEMVAIVIFASCYRPPKNTNNELLFEEIKRLASRHRKNPMWIVGDSNFPDIGWEVKSINNYQYPKQINERFIDLIDSCSMEQVVNFPTRKQNTLDLLITNRPSFINKCIPVPGFGDHDSPILSNLICHPHATKPIERKIHNWKKVNLEELGKNVKKQMVIFVRGNKINTAINHLWQQFSSKIKQLQEKFVPSRMSSSHYSQLWFNQECKKHVRRKKRLYNKARRTGLGVGWFRFKDTAAISRKTSKKA